MTNVLPESVEEAVGLGLMTVISFTAGCNGGLSEDNYRGRTNIDCARVVVTD